MKNVQKDLVQVFFKQLRNESLTFLIVLGEWTTWGNWSLCSVTCGGGHKSRKRKCFSIRPNEEVFCKGNNEEIRRCHENISCDER